MASASKSSAAGKAPAPAPRVAAKPVHPLAGRVMSSADAVVQVLADEGVDVIFGYSGGAILPTYDAIFRYNENRATREQIRLVVPATEQGAGFMAAGYARASGRVGVGSFDETAEFRALTLKP